MATGGGAARPAVRGTGVGPVAAGGADATTAEVEAAAVEAAKVEACGAEATAAANLLIRMSARPLTVAIAAFLVLFSRTNWSRFAGTKAEKVACVSSSSNCMRAANSPFTSCSVTVGRISSSMDEATALSAHCSKASASASCCEQSCFFVLAGCGQEPVHVGAIAAVAPPP